MLSLVMKMSIVLLIGVSLPGGAFGQGTETDPCLPYLAATPAASGDEGELGHAGGGAPDASPESGFPELDLAFIDLMATHHEGAIAMGEIAVVHAGREEIAILGQRIVESQREEQVQLLTWRDAWFPDVPVYDDAVLMAVFDQEMVRLELPADGGGLDHLDPVLDAQTLCSSSEPFDLAFIERMIPHHEAAIDMANVLLVSGVNDELKGFARQVIDAQTAEINQMEIWREVWFAATPVA